MKIDIPHIPALYSNAVPKVKLQGFMFRNLLKLMCCTDYQVMPAAIFDIAALLIMSTLHASVSMHQRQFVYRFGTTAHYCAKLYALVVSPSRTHPGRLLFALLFLNMYGDETQNSAMYGVDECMFRKLTWFYVKRIAHLMLYVKYSSLLVLDLTYVRTDRMGRSFERMPLHRLFHFRRRH